MVEFVPLPSRGDTHSLITVPVLLAGRVVRVVEVVADEMPPDETARVLIGQIAGQLGLVAERERTALALAEARDEAMRRPASSRSSSPR